MIYRVPPLSDEDHHVLALIGKERDELSYLVGHSPARWSGTLRRNTFVRALQGSNSIEGYNASIDEIDAILDDERPESVEEETRRALLGYREALTHILQTRDDPDFQFGIQLIKSLHFMMLSYDLSKLPGQWRPGTIYVVRQPENERVYEGPDAKLVPALMQELVAQVANADATPAIVRAAIAHLNLTMIHPFKDGNGRMARALQTLILTREGVVEPIFSSIEEWLGRNTSAYYRVLAEVGQGRWSPKRDASPWIRFCLRAHYQQAATLVRRNREYGSIWDEVSTLVLRRRLPERCEAALVNAALGYRVRNSQYRAGSGTSQLVASRDLKRLCDIGLLAPEGEKRGRTYIAAAPLLEIRSRHRRLGRAPDPYDLVRNTAQPPLPGLG